MSVLPSLRKFLDSRETHDQTSVLLIRILLRADPKNRDTKRVVLNHLTPSDAETQGRIIELLGFYQVKQIDYQDAVLNRIGNSYPSFVRRCAIKASSRLDADTVARARPLIQAIADDPADDSEVRDAARSFLLNGSSDKVNGGQ